MKRKTSESREFGTQHANPVWVGHPSGKLETFGQVKLPSSFTRLRANALRSRLTDYYGSDTGTNEGLGLADWPHLAMLNVPCSG